MSASCTSEPSTAAAPRCARSAAGVRATTKDAPALTSTNPDPRVLLALGLAVFPLPVGGTTARRGGERTIVGGAEALGGWPVGANVGVPCRVNSLVVLDLDRKGGVDGAAVLAAAA